MRSWVWGLAASLALAGCGGIGSSALNPANWFGGGGQEEEILPENATVIRDPRPAIQQVTLVAVEDVPGGAILHARGLVPVPGWYAADLVLDPARSGDGILTYGFRAAPPATPSQGGGRALIVTAATFLSEDDLAGVREIRVAAQSNIRSVRP